MATGELQDCIEISRKLFDRAIRSVKDGDLDRARTVVKKKNKMRKAQKQLKRAHIARVNEGLCDASMTEDYSAIIYSLDRIVDNCVSIAEETLDHLSFVNFSEDEADEERPADIIAEINAEEILRSMRIVSKKKMQMLQIQMMQMAAPILRLTRQQIFIKFTFDLQHKDRRLCLNGVYWCQKER